MNLNDITLVIAVDKRHLAESFFTWPTWMKFKPELKSMKKIIIYDRTQLQQSDLVMYEGGDVRYIPWHMDGVDQREKMLTSLVKIPANEVTTKWYLKLDVDAIATKDGQWIKDEWFEPRNGEFPVYVSHRWTFSKPADILFRLDNWGDTVNEIKQCKRLDIPFDPQSSRVASKRIISWCFFGNTEWTKFINGLCGERLPVPSQDTLLYYCATRLKKHTVATNMKNLGWDHLRLRALKELSRELLK